MAGEKTAAPPVIAEGNLTFLTRDFQGQHQCSCPVPLASGLCHLEENLTEVAEFHLGTNFNKTKTKEQVFLEEGDKDTVEFLL